MYTSCTRFMETIQVWKLYADDREKSFLRIFHVRFRIDSACFTNRTEIFSLFHLFHDKRFLFLRNILFRWIFSLGENNRHAFDVDIVSARTAYGKRTLRLVIIFDVTLCVGPRWREPREHCCLPESTWLRLTRVCALGMTGDWSPAEFGGRVKTNVFVTGREERVGQLERFDRCVEGKTRDRKKKTPDVWPAEH